MTRVVEGNTSANVEPFDVCEMTFCQSTNFISLLLSLELHFFLRVGIQREPATEQGSFRDEYRDVLLGE
jgi:hypothetical protein